MLKLKKMTSKEFIIWLKGFVEACHEYQPTPKQWDLLKEELAKINDKPNTYIIELDKLGLNVTTTK
jgi:hypothetical protein